MITNGLTNLFFMQVFIGDFEITLKKYEIFGIYVQLYLENLQVIQKYT